MNMTFAFFENTSTNYKLIIINGYIKNRKFFVNEPIEVKTTSPLSGTTISTTFKTNVRVVKSSQLSILKDLYSKNIPVLCMYKSFDLFSLTVAKITDVHRSYLIEIPLTFKSIKE